MDEKIISAIQEYKNKQKKYNSKLKESLKKEVLQAQQPKSNNSIQKKQELEELRRELDLLNDLDNFDHLPPDPITDKDTPSYEEYDEDKSNNDYDEYLIIKENNSNISEPIEHSVTTNDDFLNELDSLSSSLEQEPYHQVDLSAKTISNNDIFSELSSSQKSDLSIETSVQDEQQYLDSIEHSPNDDFFSELDELSFSLKQDLSIQESIQQEPEIVKNTENSTNESDIFNELDDLSSSQEPDLSIQESIQQEPEIVKNTEKSINKSDIFNELDDLSSFQEPDLSIQESICQEPEIVKNTEKSTNELDIFNDLDNLSSSQEPDLSIQESIQQETEFVKNTEESTNELDIFNELDDLSSSQESDLSIQEPIQQESEESEIIKPIDEFTNESSTVKVNDNVDQTIEFLDQLADSIIEEPKNENGEFLEMQENLKLLDEISQNPDLREQIYQKNSLKNDLISSKEENNNKPISLYLEESNTENSILESDLHFSLEAELHSLNEEFQLTDKVAEPPKFIIQEPKPKKIDKKSPLIELDNIPKFQNETQDYIKLDQKIPVAENPPTWTPDEELIKILEAKKELRLIQSETDKILAACSFFNPKLFKTYLYPEIHLEEALLVGDFFINKSNDFFDFHFITVQLSFLIDMKFILHQLISYMNEKYKKDQSDETRMQISKLNSFEFKLHKFIHKLAIPASKESVPGDIKNLLKNKQTLEVSLMNKQEFLFFLDQKVHFYE